MFYKIELYLHKKFKVTSSSYYAILYVYSSFFVYVLLVILFPVWTTTSLVVPFVSAAYSLSLFHPIIKRKIQKRRFKKYHRYFSNVNYWDYIPYISLVKWHRDFHSEYYTAILEEENKYIVFKLDPPHTAHVSLFKGLILIYCSYATKPRDIEAILYHLHTQNITKEATNIEFTSVTF